MLKKRILASSMASVLALGSVSVTAFAEDTEVKDYGEAATLAELKDYVKDLADFIDKDLDKYGTIQGEQIRDAYTHAQAVLDNSTSTDDDAAFAYQMLKSLYEAKVIYTNTQLKGLISECKKDYDSQNVLNESSSINDLIYTQESYAEFTDAYEEAEYAVDSTDSREVTDAYITLQEEHDTLKKKEIVKKSQFRATITEYQDIASKMNKYEYTRQGVLTVAPTTGEKAKELDKDADKSLGQRLVDSKAIVTYGDLFHMIYGASDHEVRFWDKAYKFFNDNVKDKYENGNKSECANPDSLDTGYWIGSDELHKTAGTLNECIVKEYERLAGAASVVETSDDDIVAAYNAAKDAIDVFNGWDADKLERSSNAGVSKTMKEYHNRLVETFNINVFNQLLFDKTADAKNRVTERSGLSKYKGAAKVRVNKLSITRDSSSADPYEVKLTYDYAKHTVVTDKTYTIIIDKATKKMFYNMDGLGIGGVNGGSDNIADWMFQSSSDASDIATALDALHLKDANNEDRTFDTQNIIAKNDLVQWLPYDYEADTDLGTAGVQSIAVDALIATLDEAEDTLLTEGANALVVQPDGTVKDAGGNVVAGVTVDTAHADSTDGKVIIPAAFVKAFNGGSPLSTRTVVPANQVYYYLKTTSNDTTVKNDVKAHNDQVKALKDAYDNFIEAYVAAGVPAAVVTSAKDTVKATYDGLGAVVWYEESVSVINKTNPLEADYNADATLDAYKWAAAADVTAATDGAKANYTMSADTAKEVTGVADQAAVTYKYVVAANQSDSTSKAAAAANNGQIDAIKTAATTYETSVANKSDLETKLAAAKTAYATYKTKTSVTFKDSTNGGDLSAPVDLNPVTAAVSLGSDHDVVDMAAGNASNVTAITGITDASPAIYDFTMTKAEWTAIKGDTDPATLQGASDAANVTFKFYSVSGSVVAADKDTKSSASVVDTYNTALKDFYDAFKAYKDAAAKDVDTATNLASLKEACGITGTNAAANKAKFITETVTTIVSANPMSKTADETDVTKAAKVEADTATFTIDGATAKAIDSDLDDTKTYVFKKLKVKDGYAEADADTVAAAVKSHNDSFDALKIAYDAYQTLSADPTAPTSPTQRGGYDPNTNPYLTDKTITSAQKINKVRAAFQDYYDYKKCADAKFKATNDDHDGYAEIPDAYLGDPLDDIINQISKGGKVYSSLDGGGDEWGLINRQLAYALDDLLREDSSSNAHINEVKDQIKIAQDLINQTGDAALFDVALTKGADGIHTQVVKARQDAIDWVSAAEAEGWKYDTVVLGNNTDQAKKAIKDKNDLLKKWLDSFTTSYGDIAKTIVEVAKAFDDKTTADEDLKKQLTKVAIEISTLENSDITLNGGDADENAAFNTDREFQAVNRLKNNRKDKGHIALLSDDEEALVEDYKKLVELWDKAKNPTSNVPGDVDGNTKFELADVSMMISKYMSGEAVDAKANKAWDMDNDEKFTLADVTAAIAKYMG